MNVRKLRARISVLSRQIRDGTVCFFARSLKKLTWSFKPVFIGGNGGANPRHATLFATDVPPSKVVKIIDRYLMLYIRTADKLTRTARWVESFEGGVEVSWVSVLKFWLRMIDFKKLQKVLLEDELGICADLEKEMEALVGTYFDEWDRVVKDVEKRRQFRQFANTEERVLSLERIDTGRGQRRPADWPKGEYNSPSSIT